MMQDYDERGVPEWARDLIFRANLLQGIYYLRDNQGLYEWEDFMRVLYEQLNTLVTTLTFKVRCMATYAELEITAIVPQDTLDQPRECEDVQACWGAICSEVVIPLMTLEGSHCGNMSDLTPVYIGPYTDENGHTQLKLRFNV